MKYEIMNKIPVILLNYNSSTDCRECVADLKRQEGVELDIVIVDNCSPREREQDTIRQLCTDEGCTFIQAKENRGYNAGNNIGLRYAAEKGYKYALIANPDMRFLQTDYVKKLTEKLETDKDIVVVASDIIGLDGFHQNPICRDRGWRDCFYWMTSIFKRATDRYKFIANYHESHQCIKVSGCCFMVQIDFLKSIDYFDEKVFLYSEEAILSRQIEQRGKKMYYMEDIQAVHAHLKRAKGNPVVRFKHWEKSRLYFIEHYSGDNRLEKEIAKLSVKLYVFCITLFFKLRYKE